MKSLKILTLFAVVMMSFGLAYAGECGSGCTATCCEDTDITVYGSARHRLEIDGRTFAADANMDWMQYMRSRLGVKASRGNSGMVFEVQDSRILGDAPGTFDFTNGNSHFPRPGDLTKNLDLGYRNDFGVRQAYLWHKPCDKGAIQVGRFGVNLHNQRLIGQVGWHNVGRTTEGVLFKRSINDDITFIGSALQVAEINADDADGDNIMDPMFFVADLNFAEMGFDLFFYMLKNGMEDLGNNHKLMTFGAYSNRSFGSNLFYDAMFAMQSGSYDVGTDKAVTTVDLSGMLVNLEVGMKMESGTKVSALVDYTTGDDPSTPEVENFNNLLYTGHKWNGFMDFMMGAGALQGNNGLMDIALRVAHPVRDDLWVKADAHLFATVEEYADGKTALGNELDISVVKSAGSMKIQGGLSVFLPAEDAFGADAEMAKWAYLQSTFGF